MSASGLIVMIVRWRRLMVTVLRRSGLITFRVVTAGQDAARRNALRACREQRDSQRDGNLAQTNLHLKL